MTPEDERIIEALDELCRLVESGWYPHPETCQAIARVNATVARADRARPEPAGRVDTRPAVCYIKRHGLQPTLR